MTTINLLPWRKQRREQNKKAFLALLWGVVGLSVIFTAFAYFVMRHRIDIQMAINQFYTQQNAILDKQLEKVKDIKDIKENLLARMQVIQNLERIRPATVLMLDELVRILPEGVYVNQLKKEGNIITLVGESESNSQISTLMRRIEGSRWMSDPILTEIKSDDADDQYSRDFSLQMTQTIPKDDIIHTASLVVPSEQGKAHGTE